MGDVITAVPVNKNYYPQIDGLRFVAIFLVLIEHFASGIAKYFSAGYYGVDLFFVISGFLITNILVQPNGRSFKTNYYNFIGRRTLRIFPVYYLSIFILWLFNLAVIRQYLGWFVTYTFNYAWIKYNLPLNPVTHFWSLSVEEQFYLFWPLIVLSLKYKQDLLLGITVLIIITGYAQLFFGIFPGLTQYNNAGLLTRMSSLGLGAVGAILAARKSLPYKLLSSKVAEYIVAILLVLALLTTYRYKFLVLGLCSLYLVLKAASVGFSINAVTLFLQNRWIIYVGTIAYGIYIFHPLIGYYFDKLFFDSIWKTIDFKFFPMLQWQPWIIKFPLYTLLSIGVASLSFKYIERPILRLKTKYF